MADSSIDPDVAIAVLSKTQSSQKQRIAELGSEVVQLKDENERLNQRVQQLERMLATGNTSPASALTATPTTARTASAAAALSPIASTQPLLIALSPATSPGEKQQQPDNSPSPTQRMTRSRTRNSFSQPTLARGTTVDGLLNELSQQERAAANSSMEEEKEAGGKRRRKASAGERSMDKKAKQEETSNSSSSPPIITLTAEIEELLTRARAEKDQGSAEFDRGARFYSNALERYQDALELLTPTFPSPTALSSYPSEVADLFASLHHKIGVVHNKRGDFEAACEQFDAAVHWQPGWWRLWKALGYSMFARKHYPAALKALEQAMQCGVDEKKDRADLAEKIELARSIINKLTTPQQQPRQVDLSPCRSPVPRGQPAANTANTANPTRLAGRLDRADGRQPLGELTNHSANAPAVASSQPAKPHSNDKQILQLPLITKDGIRDLLGRETFALAGELHEKKRFVQFLADKGGVVRGRTRAVEGNTSRLIEQMCKFEGDRCIEYSCKCMEQPDKNETGEPLTKPPQAKVKVAGSGEEVWRYAACEHIGAMLLTVQAKQHALLQPAGDKENGADMSLTPSKRAALASSQPSLYVTPSHRPSAADEQRDRALAAHYSSMKQDALKAALKANNAKTSATVKSELVARCVESELRGVPDKCTVCRYGNMYWAGGVWRCRGMYDVDKKQYVRCDNVAVDWPTRPWSR